MPTTGRQGKQHTPLNYYPTVRTTDTCCLQIEPLVGEPATRADNTLINGEGTTAEETVVNDLTVIQFDGNGDATDESIVIRTFNGKLNLTSLSIGLMQPPSKGSQYLYFICNAGDVFANFVGTLGELEEKILTISREGGLSGGIVMTGACRSTLVGGTPIKATLTTTGILTLPPFVFRYIPDISLLYLF